MSQITQEKSPDGFVFDAIHAGGQIRLLATIPTGMRAAAPFRGQADIPASQWQPFERIRKDVPILNQGGFGSCTGHGTATAMMMTRSMAGMNFQLLSPTFIYALINGGRDAGSAPEDAVQVIQKTGTCLMSEFGESTIYALQIPQTAYQTAQRFRVSELYQVDTWEQRCSAVQQGFQLIDTVRVGNNFNDLDADGVPPASRGPGNHCISGGEGMKKARNGRWLILYRNSWDRWGLDGFFFMGEEHFAYQPYASCFALKVSLDDPQDPTNPPR